MKVNRLFEAQGKMLLFWNLLKYLGADVACQEESLETPELCVFLQPLSHWLCNSYPVPAVLYGSWCRAVTCQHSKWGSHIMLGRPHISFQGCPCPLPTPPLEFHLDCFAYFAAKY